MTGPERAVIAFAGENHGHWIDRMERLALSLHGSRPSDDDTVTTALVVDGLDEPHRSTLDLLGCDVRAVDPVHAEHRYMNKLRILEVPEIGQADGVLALDCDLVVAGDPLPEIDRDVICAQLTSGSSLPDQLWSQIHEALGLPEPSRTYRDVTSGRRGYPYFNSGVLWIPRAHALPVRSEWMRAGLELADLVDDIDGLATNIGYLDQIAFSIAMLRLDQRPRQLPLALNLPTGGFRWGSRPDVERPMILHYHANVDGDGFLRVPNHPVLRAEIDSFNRAWAAHRGVAYRRPRRQTLKKRLIRESLTTRRLLRFASRVRLASTAGRSR